MRSGPRISRSAWPRYCGRSPARRSGCGGSSSQKGRSSSAGSGSAPAGACSASPQALAASGRWSAWGRARRTRSRPSRALSRSSSAPVLRRAAGFGKQRGAGGGWATVSGASRATAMTGSVSVMRSSFSRSRPRICAGCQAGCDSASSSSVGGRARRRSCSRLSVILHRQLARGQPAAQLFGQPAGHGQHRVGVLQVFHQLDAAGEARRRLDPALRLGRQTIGGVQRRQQFGRAAPLRPARQGAQVAQRGAADVPASPGAAAPGQQGQRRRACERAWAGSAPAGRRAVRGAAPAARRRRRWAPCPATPASPVPATWRRPGAPARGPRKNCRLAPTPSTRWPRRPARPRACIAAGPARRLAARRPRPADCAAAARPGARWRRRRGACPSTHARKARGRGQGDHALLLQHGVRLGVVRPVRAYGVQRQAAQAGGDPEAHGGRVFEGAGPRPTMQRRIAGRPRRLGYGWTVRPRGRQRQQGRAWRGRRRTDAGRRTAVAGLGRQMQPAQRFGTDLGQPAEQGAAAAVPEDLLGGPERVRRFFRADPEQLPGIQPPAHPGDDIGRVRRLHQRDRTPCLQLGQGRAQADLAHAGMRRQQLDQAAHRPTAIRQLGRQRRMSGRQAARAAPPAGWRATRRDGCVRGTAWRGGRGARRVAVYYCINIQHMAPVRRNLMRLNLDGRLPMIPRNPT